MSPTYNPDDWSEKFDPTLKYEPMSEANVNRILTQYRRDDILNYIKELWNLIDYQRDFINQQERKIIGFKHLEAWKHYDKPIEKYNSTSRKYEI